MNNESICSRENIRIFNQNPKKIDTLCEKNEHGSLTKLMRYSDIGNFLVEISPESIAEIKVSGKPELIHLEEELRDPRCSYFRTGGYGEIIVKHKEGEERYEINNHNSFATVLGDGRYFIQNNGSNPLQLFLTANFRIRDYDDFQFKSIKESIQEYSNP